MSAPQLDSTASATFPGLKPFCTQNAISLVPRSQWKKWQEPITELRVFNRPFVDYCLLQSKDSEQERDSQPQIWHTEWNAWLTQPEPAGRDGERALNA